MFEVLAWIVCGTVVFFSGVWNGFLLSVLLAVAVLLGVVFIQLCLDVLRLVVRTSSRVRL